MKLYILIFILLITNLLFANDNIYVENEIIYVKEKTPRQILTDKANKLVKIKKLAKNNIKYQWLLVDMYSNGSDITPPIFKQKLKWLKILAKNKELKAIKMLAEIYFYGHTWQLKKNYLKSLNYYKEAAKQKDTISMIKIGNFYFYGIGIKKNMIKSKYWYAKSQKYGDKNSQFFLNKF